RPSLALEHTQVAPGGSTTLAVRFELSEHWHLYWTNPGDSGDAPAIELSLPEGVVAGAVQWPMPTREVLPGDLLGHHYDGELVLLIPLSVDAGVAAGPLQLEAQLGWLVCKDVCLMGDAEVQTTLKVGAEATLDAEAKPLFARARARMPRAPRAGELEASWEGDALTLRVAGAAELVFFPESTPAAAELLARGRVEGERLTIRFPSLPAQPATIRGLLQVSREGKTEGLRVSVAAPAGTN
ncbi:MAG: hypothetical protein KDD82_05580, partial [Planctomycetes bacterium]|nr:hypothetical protein [Planctomycetota bacterium]